MRGLRRALDRILETGLVLLMTTMVLNVLWQVFTRYALRRPSSYTEELARYLLVWVGLLGAAYAWRRGMHLAIDFFAERMGRRVRQLSSVLAALAVALFSLAVMVLGGLQLVMITVELEQRSAALGLSLGWVYLALPVSGLLILFFTVAELIAPDGAAERPEISP